MISAKPRGLRWLRPLTVLILTSNLAAINQLADAQIVPDDTLGAERSRLTSQGDKERIEGGAVRGSLLFHSFSEFNVNGGQQVYFANPAAISNILTRVTGRNHSDILGTLGVEGRANLFLLNPNGIVFGPHARLNVAGSFTATTADSIWLDRYEFSAINPQAPLLTINLASGLQYGRNAPERVIENQGNLAVGTGQQLSLLGGTVRHSGSLIAPGGLVELSGDRVELSGTVDTRAANGTVGTFLLDPKDILIQADTPTSGATISAALAANKVVLQADNDITVDDDIASSSGNDLTFLSGRSLTVAPNRLILLNGGNLTARINDETAIAANRDPGIAQFVMAAGSQILTNGGNLDISSGSFGQTSQINTAKGIIRTASATGKGGNLTLSALGDVTTGLLDTGSSTSRGGNLSVSSTGGTITTTESLATDSVTQAGDIFLTAAGDIDVTRSITANALGQAGNLSLTAGGDLNLTSNGFIRGGTPTFGTTGNIASVGARSGSISLTSGGTLSGQDVRVANIVTGSSPGKETIIKARSILLDRSSILALTNSSGRSGDVQVNAAKDVVLWDSNIATNANDNTSGDAGDLTLNTQSLSIIRTPGIVLPFRGVGVGTTTDEGSSGNSGNLIINASESVELVGDQPGAYVINPARVVANLLGTASTAISTVALGSGNSGNLTIDTQRLVTRDGASISTFPLVGQGGDLTINASEILLQGAGGIGTGTLGLQRAGDLAITADRITLSDGAQLTAATAGKGNSGDLTLSVRQLHVLNGSVISTVTLKAGEGGVTTIRNPELIEVVGTSPGGEFSSSIRADSVGTGNAGRLDITAARLSIRQGGVISVSGAGTGNSGNINIDVRSMLLDHGSIAATSASGEGGNIKLQSADLLLLRRGSSISSTAGQAKTGGNGGNINIGAGFIVAVPRENSNITANAFEGRGGNIKIATQGLFGLQSNDITASSEFGLDGTVTIDVLNPNPASNLVELPTTPVDPAGQIVARCTAPTNQANSFVVTGRGGLPQDPRQFLPGQAVIQDLRSTVENAIVETPQIITANLHNDTPQALPIIEAQEWRVNAQGDVELVAPLAQAQSIAHLNCQSLTPGDKQ